MTGATAPGGDRTGERPAGAFVVIASLWVRAGRRDAFEAFERKALRVMATHGGVLEHAVRVDRRAGADDPDEIHVVRFPSAAHFDAYRRDPAVAALGAERESAIARTTLAFGASWPAQDD